MLDSVPGLFGERPLVRLPQPVPEHHAHVPIDPLGLWQPGEDPVPGEDGATFARSGAILPELLETLHVARSRAMAGDHEALSRAIKIVMNSFYGVLGTPGCRFFDARLPTSITRRGHAMIERARAFFEARLPVLYGDTDSLFVRPGRDLGNDEAAALGRELAATLTRTLAAEIAREFRVESRLELRFESHYERFLMPTMRAGDRGSKKRYAGLVRKADGGASVVVKRARGGANRLDAARAQGAARAAAARVLGRTLRSVARRAGAGPGRRAPRRRAGVPQAPRHELTDYALEGAPPHVQAARMLGRGSLKEIEYVVTTRGAEPVEKRTAPIDLAHYRDAQLAPVRRGTRVPGHELRGNRGGAAKSVLIAAGSLSSASASACRDLRGARPEARSSAHAPQPRRPAPPRQDVRTGTAARDRTRVRAGCPWRRSRTRAARQAPSRNRSRP